MVYAPHTLRTEQSHLNLSFSLHFYLHDMMEQIFRFADTNISFNKFSINPVATAAVVKKGGHPRINIMCIFI